MIKTTTMKETDTIVGYFKKLKKGDVIHIAGAKKDSFRLEAFRWNQRSRLLGEIKPREVRYTVSTTQKEGYVTIAYK